MGSKAKGAKGERELRGRLDTHEFKIAKVPGAYNTENDYDDLVAGDAHGLLCAFEAKRRRSDRFYIQSEQIGELTDFATNFGIDCRPVIAVRFVGVRDTTWYVREVDDCRRTDSGNIPIHRERVQDEWETLTEYVERRRGEIDG